MAADDRRARLRTAVLSAGGGTATGALLVLLGADRRQAVVGGLLGANLALSAENRFRLAAVGRAGSRTAAEVDHLQGVGVLVETIADEVRRLRSAMRGDPGGDDRAATHQDLERVQKRTLKAVDVQRRQLEAVSQLALLLRPDRPVPATGGWALSGDALALVVGLLLQRRPARVVECGSGTSSVWLGLALRRAGGGSLVSLEHEEEYAARSAELVAEHGLSEHVEIRYAPLSRQALGDEEVLWYDRGSWQDLRDIELLLVDGPPRASAPAARAPAVPLLRDRLAAGATVVLDDAARPEERRAFESWEQFLGVRGELRLDLEKGAGVLRLPG